MLLHSARGILLVPLFSKASPTHLRAVGILSSLRQITFAFGDATLLGTTASVALEFVTRHFEPRFYSVNEFARGERFRVTGLHRPHPLRHLRPRLPLHPRRLEALLR